MLALAGLCGLAIAVIGVTSGGSTFGTGYEQARGAVEGHALPELFFIDKLACNDVFPEWAMTRFAGGTGGDRQVLERLRSRPFGTSGAHTLFYRTSLERQHPYLLWRFKCAGVDLSRYMQAEAIPGDAVWRQCYEHDRAQQPTVGNARPTA